MAKIKVIKKDVQKKPVPVPVKSESEKQIERKIESNISNWIKDYQENKRRETKQAFAFIAQLQAV